MKKYFPFLIVLVVLLGVGAKLLPPKNSGPYDVVGFGQLPVLENGRFKPLHTVARTSLLQFQGRQRVVAADGRELTPGEWLMDVTFHSDLADTYQTFEIVHPEVLAIFDLNPDSGLAGKRFSFRQMDGKLAELERQAKLAFPVESAVRTTFQRAVVQLYANLLHYQRLKYTLVGPGRDDFLGDLLVEELAARHREFERPDNYGPQCIVLSAPGAGFFLRANMWPAAEDNMLKASGGTSFSFGLPHDHNFSFLTLGYFGPGYWSDYYTFDHEAVAG